MKHWSIELPGELGRDAADLLGSYVGTVGIEQPCDFVRNTVRFFGEHDPDDAGAQAAVAQIAALARRPRG
jgi:hypothetical protein